MKEKIRILQIISNLETCNGITSYLLNYYKNIDLNKFQIDFLVCKDMNTDSQKNFEFLSKNGSHIYYLQQIGIKNMFGALRKMNDFFRKNASKYDIVHCHMLNNGAFFLHYAKKYGVRIRILHSHVTQSADIIFKKIRNDLLIPIAIKNATHYFACSEEAGKFIFKKNNFIVINNAINIERFKYNEKIRRNMREKFKIREEDIVIGNVGRLCPQKNQLFLLDIFKKMSDKKLNLKLIMIGDGPWKYDIQNKMEKMKLEQNIILLEPQENIENFYQMFDLFLFPSRYEGLGIVLIEAQTSGLKCYASDVIPTRAQITENYYVQSLEDSDEEWAEKILEILKDNSQRESKEENARMYGYDIKNESKKLEKIYINMYKENNGGKCGK